MTNRWGIYDLFWLMSLSLQCDGLELRVKKHTNTMGMVAVVEVVEG